MCGLGPTVAMLTALKEIGGERSGTGMLRDFWRYFRRFQRGRGICGNAFSLTASEMQMPRDSSANEKRLQIAEPFFLSRDQE